jgi:hypothetical protein
VEERGLVAAAQGHVQPNVHGASSLFGFRAVPRLPDVKTAEPRWRHKANAGTLIRVGRHPVVLGESRRCASWKRRRRHRLAQRRRPGRCPSSTGPSLRGRAHLRAEHGGDGGFRRRRRPRRRPRSAAEDLRGFSPRPRSPRPPCGFEPAATWRNTGLLQRSLSCAGIVPRGDVAPRGLATASWHGLVRPFRHGRPS